MAGGICLETLKSDLFIFFNKIYWTQWSFKNMELLQLFSSSSVFSGTACGLRWKPCLSEIIVSFNMMHGTVAQGIFYFYHEKISQ